MKNFDWNGFITGELGVQCKTNELAKDFFEYCKKQNIVWCDGDELDPNHTEWNNYKNDTCYIHDEDGVVYIIREDVGNDVIVWEFENSITIKLEKYNKLVRLARKQFEIEINDLEKQKQEIESKIQELKSQFDEFNKGEFTYGFDSRH